MHVRTPCEACFIQEDEEHSGDVRAFVVHRDADSLEDQDNCLPNGHADPELPSADTVDRVPLWCVSFDLPVA